MTRRLKYIWLAALLALAFTATAAAAEPESPLSRSKKADKALVLLGALGMNSPEAVALVESLDKRVENGKLTIGEERFSDGTASFTYGGNGRGAGVKALELKYAPDDSQWEYTAHPDSLMANYKIKF